MTRSHLHTNDIAMSSVPEIPEPKPVFRFRRNQPVVWWHRKLEKSNQVCLYCGRFLGDGSIPSDKEHLIGRAFGPDGAFLTGQEFNFIFRGCCRCNNEKADVERHLSTVTVFDSPARATDKGVNDSALNKAEKDHHPAEGKPVCDSFKELTATFERPGFQMKFELIAPPQAIPVYVQYLAYRHVQGLFALITNENPLDAATTTVLPEDHIQFFSYFHHRDWGNVQLLDVYRRALAMPRLALIVTANGFFKMGMRRTPGERGEWFWALEWNKSLRVFGGITDRKPPLIFDGLPEFKWTQTGPDTRMRPDFSLDPEQDTLFAD